METTSRTIVTPIGRSVLWSHNTSYQAALGVHSELGRKAHAMRVTGQRQLSSNLSTIRSIHRKELRSLNHHRKSLESSMLAYSQKMKQISSARLSMCISDKASSSGKTTESSYFDKILGLSKPGQYRSTVSEPGNCRLSVDSGIDVTDAIDTESNRKLSSTGRNTDRLSQKHRPISFSSAENQDSVDQKPSSDTDDAMSHRITSINGNVAHTRRRRKTGTTERPDLFALKLSLTKTMDDREESLSENPMDVPPDDNSDPTFVEFPFPQSSPEQSEIRVDEHGVLITPPEDTHRNHGISSRTSQSSSRKSKKTKENYWSYRKSPRHSLSTTTPLHTTTNKNSIRSNSVSLHHNGPQPLVQPQKKPVRSTRRSRKTYHHEFRYSDAVDTVIKVLDKTPVDNTKASRYAMRRVSETLPTLDIQDLKLERQRQSKKNSEKSVTEKTEKLVQDNADTSVTGKDDSSKTTSLSAFVTMDDSCDTNGDNDSPPPYFRERSFSAPELSANLAREAGEDEEEEETEEEEKGGLVKRGDEQNVREVEVAMKSLLKKFDGEYFNNVPPRKTVHFRLPPLEQRPE